MDKKLDIIKKWLGTGSINIFGLPFSGKDTIGVHLAEAIGGRFLSSGLILRAAETEDAALMHEMNAGKLAATDKFRKIVLPYFTREDLREFPLILSSVGRWEGEEYEVIRVAENSGHPVKAAVLLNISEAEVHMRWESAEALNDRGERGDDKSEAVLNERIREFMIKTMPVIETYRKRGLLLPIMARGEREAVYQNLLNALAQKAQSVERIIPLNVPEE